MLHQSRSQLVTELADFRDRFVNSIGAEICLGCRTPEDFAYLRDTDREINDYLLSWHQPLIMRGNELRLHPRYAYQRTYEEPPLIGARGTTKPRMNHDVVLEVSAHPQAGFARCFRNEGLWAYDGSWVPFRWYHFMSPQEFQDACKSYPKALPGQRVYSASENAPRREKQQAGFERAASTMESGDVRAAIEKLAALHQQELFPKK